MPKKAEEDIGPDAAKDMNMMQLHNEREKFDQYLIGRC